MSLHPIYIKRFYAAADEIVTQEEELTCDKNITIGKIIGKVMDAWVNGIDKLIKLLEESNFIDLDHKKLELYKERVFTYSEFYYLTLNTLDESELGKIPAYTYTKTFSNDLRNKRFGNLKFTPNDYKEYILSLNSIPSNYFLKKKEVYFNLNALQAHTYCVAKTRSGKTELLKVIINEFIINKPNSTSLLILDPHGELSRELRRLTSISNRLKDVIYLDPTIDNLHSPVFNPFQIKYSDQASLAYSTDAILEAFQQLLVDQSISGNMKRLLRHLIYALLTKDDSSLLDMLHLLTAISRNKNKKVEEFTSIERELMNHGKDSSDPITRRFFEYGWKDVDSKTVNAVIERIDGILSHPLVRNFVIGKNSFDLEDYLNNGKIVIVNLDFTKLGNIGSEAIGRLIISEAQNISARRNKLSRSERPKTIIFMDECQRFVSSAIEKALSEFSKFNTFLWLSHQYIEQIDDGMLKGMLSNTENKIIGRNSSTTLGALSSETNVTKEALMSIKKYQFHIKLGDQDSVLIKASDHLLDIPGNENYISESEAKINIDSYMIKNYYRKIMDDNGLLSDNRSFTSLGENIDKEQSRFRVILKADDF